MKKIFTLLIIILTITACQKQIVPGKSRYTPINVGTVPNDGTGDPLRLMAQKTNAGFAEVFDSLLNKPTIAQMTKRIADSLDALRDSADVADDYYYLKTSGEALEAQIANLEGAGGGYSKYKIQFSVGASGFPADGDSTVTHTTWAGKEVELYRDGLSQRYNSTATNTVDGFRLNNTTGAITVNPAFSTGEIIKIDAYNPVTVEWLTLSGTESTLLTGLRGFWKLDETTGTAVNDATGTYNGTTTATVGTVGHFGYAETFDGTTDFVDCGTTVGDVGTNDFSVTAWVYCTGAPANRAGIFGNWGSYPYFYLGIDYNRTVVASLNFNNTPIEIGSENPLTLNSWTHIAITADRSGNVTLYINGVAQTDVKSISAHSAVNVVNNNTSAIGQVGNTLSGYNFTGIIDDVGLWIKALSSGEVTEAMNKTHPF